MTPPAPKHPRMQRRWTLAYLLPLAFVAVVELLGVATRFWPWLRERLGPAFGNTVSEHHWKLGATSWLALPLDVLLVWYVAWHRPFGRDRALGWPDLVAVVAGVAYWWLCRLVARA